MKTVWRSGKIMIPFIVKWIAIDKYLQGVWMIIANMSKTFKK